MFNTSRQTNIEERLTALVTYSTFELIIFTINKIIYICNPIFKNTK